MRLRFPFSNRSAEPKPKPAPAVADLQADRQDESPVTKAWIRYQAQRPRDRRPFAVLSIPQQSPPFGITTLPARDANAERARNIERIRRARMERRL